MRAGRRALPALLLALAGPASAGEPVRAAVPAEVPAAARTAALRVGVPAGPDAVAGFDRSLFAEVAREAGLGVAFEVMPPEAAPAALDAGRIDVAAGPYRPGQAAARPGALRDLASLAPDGDALLKRRGDGSVKLPGDAAGKALGLLGPAPSPVSSPVPPAAPAAARLRTEAAALRARVAVAPRAFPDPLGALAAGRVAALIGDLPEVAAAALARPDAFEVVGLVPGGARPLAALLRGDRPELADRLDAALDRMRADGRLAAVQRRWFGVALAPSPAGQPAGASATVKP